MTSTPCCTAISASSAVWTPLSMNGSPAISLIMSIVSQVSEARCRRSGRYAPGGGLVAREHRAFPAAVMGHVHRQRQGCVAGLLDAPDDLLRPLHVPMHVELEDLRRRGGGGRLLQRRLRDRAHGMHDAEFRRGLGRSHSGFRMEHLQRADRREDGGDAQLLPHEGGGRIDVDTSTRMRGRKAIRSKASRFRRRVVSDSEPPTR